MVKTITPEMRRLAQTMNMERLIGATVIAIQEKDSEVYSPYIIIFDSGLRLTAEDGEYGCDAFEFV